MNETQEIGVIENFRFVESPMTAVSPLVLASRLRMTKKGAKHKHNPAGTKIARLAHKGRITIR